MPYLADQNEKEILEYWDQNKIFEKSVKNRPDSAPYVFYDGPPFATGLPHYGHIVASLMKDVVPRYWTMNGKRVERVWGWDCHGLPIENIIEDEMGLKSKKEIEEMGIVKFNEACRSTVLKYAEEWKKSIKRMGRWVEMESAYKTMDVNYMESVWWVFGELYKSGLIYEGYKIMHICPRCVTPLSNFEVTQGYKDVKDISVVAKFKTTNAKEKLGIDGDVYMLAWTTTPWTLPGNVALAVSKKIDYVVVKFFRTSQGELLYEPNSTENRKSCREEVVILAKDRLKSFTFRKGGSATVEELDMAVKSGNNFEYAHEIVKEFKGADLVGLKYEPLFPYFKETENAFHSVSADFVSTEDGTGIVHIAPAFGEDDYLVGQKENIGWIQHVTMDGHFVPEVTDFPTQEVKPKEDPTKTDVDVIKWLAHNGKLFSKAKFEHSYPHCWRCDTPLLNYATSSWFVKVTEMKDDLLKNNSGITWIPEHIKDGRFGKWLEGARDWAISRNRFWGAPLPIWKSEGGDVLCVGSVKELAELSGQKITDLHKHIVDEIVIEKDGKKYRRIPEVLDCWFESGSMPYGQIHYPFENKAKFESGFPAEFIAEGQDQTRGWFYTLHVLATALTRGQKPSIPKSESVPAFKNVIVNGIVLAEDGKKMSKRLKNYPDPMTVLEKYGADAMRYYLVSSPVMRAENVNFSEEGVREVYNRLINTLWNVFTFYQMFAGEISSAKVKPEQSENVLDKWILAKLKILIKEVTKNMNAYKLTEASRPIIDFVLELSQWYVRRSRDRFKGDNEDGKQFALATLRYVLNELAKIMAPFTPFIAEKIYQETKSDEQSESVHLEMWPSDNDMEYGNVLEDMEETRRIVSVGLEKRKTHNIKVRQPLNAIILNYNLDLADAYLDLIKEEVNVREVKINQDVPFDIDLDIDITPQLVKEGLAREIVRAINQIRKEKGLTREKMVQVFYATDDAELKNIFTEFAEEIKKQVLAEKITAGDGETEVEINDKKVKLSVN